MKGHLEGLNASHILMLYFVLLLLYLALLLLSLALSLRLSCVQLYVLFGTNLPLKE